VKGSSQILKLSVVIPTYKRERVLIESIEALLQQLSDAIELLIIDQTPAHESETTTQLERWSEAGIIRWIRMPVPSIPGAMNRGLLEARSPLVLFLDDDIRPHAKLLQEHLRVHAELFDLWASVGQVVQPWQTSEPLDPPHRLSGLERDFDFPFHSSLEMDVSNVMAGNLCVRREKALSIGGFDENFIGPGYRFETDFARRVIAAGGMIRFVGSAGIDHLRAESGGTRTAGSHLTSASPMNGVGDYYYALRHGTLLEASGYSLRRMLREVRTHFHLTHPWWIPVKLWGEVRAIHLARKTWRSEPKLLKAATAE
jgi:GT2 family glycosyltransferase